MNVNNSKMAANIPREPSTPRRRLVDTIGDFKSPLRLELKRPERADQSGHGRAFVISRRKTIATLLRGRAHIERSSRHAIAPFLIERSRMA
jgi:hypothetical protein